MYRRDFDAALNARIPNATLLYGESNFLISHYGRKVRDLIAQKHDVEVFSYYFDEYNPKAILDILAQQSLFAHTSVVIIKMDSIKVGLKGNKTKDIKDFLSALKDNTEHFLIIEYYNSGAQNYAKDAKALSALFNTSAFVSVRFFAPNGREALEILQQYAKALNLTISAPNLLYLFEIQNNDIGICVNELHKFTLFSGEITKSHIDSLSYGLASNSIDELCEAILSRGDYLTIAAKLDTQGVSDMDIISAMQQYFYRLFLFFVSIKSNGTNSSKDALGYALPKHIEEKCVRFATRLKEAQYVEIFNLLNAWRTQSISGRDKATIAYILSLQSIVK